VRIPQVTDRRSLPRSNSNRSARTNGVIPISSFSKVVNRPVAHRTIVRSR